MDKNSPVILNITQKEILEAIEKRALSYTKEWLFNRQNPDAGSVIAIIIADLLKESSEVINQSLERHHISLLNFIENQIKTAIPAKTFVAFRLQPSDQSYIKISEGVKLLGNTEGGDEISFVTDEEIEASYMEISQIIISSEHEDYISSVDEEVALENLNLKVFDLGRENLQRHIFYIGSSYLLAGMKKGNLSIYLVAEEKWKEMIIDPHYVKWRILTEKGWQDVEASSNYTSIPISGSLKGAIQVVLKIEEEAVLHSELSNNPLYWIGLFVVGEIPEVQISGIRMGAEQESMLPDIIYTEDIECHQEEDIYPFGKPLALYSACYISCREAMSKPGAHITLSFYLDFEILEEAISINVEQGQEASCPIYEVQESIIRADRVVWEYWNGNGWCRLKVGEEADTVFKQKDYDRPNVRKSISFLCPSDMEELSLNAYESSWIRVRLIEADHIYSIPFKEYVPVIKNLTFSYEYGSLLQAETLICHNNLEYKEVTSWLNAGEGIQIFNKVPYHHRCMFLGMDEKPSYHFQYLFVQIQNDLLMTHTDITVSYSTLQSGEILFVEGEGEDATGGLCHSGKLRLTLPEEFAKAKLFGKEKYWIKLEDTKGQFEEVARLGDNLPVISAIYQNVTEVENREEQVVYFYETDTMGEKIYGLEAENIIEVEVYVNETPSKLEVDALMASKADEIRFVQNVNGAVTNIWVKWQRVEYRSELSASKRCYYYDQMAQEVIFAENVFLTFPIDTQEESIEITYISCVGALGNVKKGSITEMAETIPYVSEVVQLMDAFGGSDFEQLESSASRISKHISQHNRMVSVEDYEALTKEAFPNIIKLRCLSNVCGDSGSREMGAITLLTLMEDYEQGDYTFEAYQKAIENEVKKYSDLYVGGNHLYVRPPVFVMTDTIIQLVVDEIEEPEETARLIEQALTEFLNPVTGGFNGAGWEIGSLPDELQLKSCINTLGIIYCSIQIEITSKVLKGGIWTPVDLTTFGQIDFTLPVSGNHQVFINQ